MKHNEKFKIEKISGFNAYSGKRETKFEVKQILTKLQLVEYVFFGICTFGVLFIMASDILKDFEVRDNVEGLYDCKESAIEQIKKYKSGLFDNSFY